MCAVEGCGRGRQARDWCKMHWRRWRKHGDPLGAAPRYQDPHVRFLEKTEPLLWSGCLVWTGARADTGYGTMSVNGKTTLMHRWAYERAYGPIPDGMHVDHVCHNKLCVEPLHLRAVTPAQNTYNHSGPSRNRRIDLPRNVYLTPAGRYVVIIRQHGKGWNYGTFDAVEDAAARAAEIRSRLFGEHAGKG